MFFCLFPYFVHSVSLSNFCPCQRLHSSLCSLSPVMFFCSLGFELFKDIFSLTSGNCCSQSLDISWMNKTPVAAPLKPGSLVARGSLQPETCTIIWCCRCLLPSHPLQMITSTTGLPFSPWARLGDPEVLAMPGPHLPLLQVEVLQLPDENLTVATQAPSHPAPQPHNLEHELC